ncbi:MAG: hypothetical protein IKY52_06155 [Clostridia bacterium]|nr:hypothetical protein [Clostridia bacterium]
MNRPYIFLEREYWAPLRYGRAKLSPSIRKWLPNRRTIDDGTFTIRSSTRQIMDGKLKAMGGSITALENFNCRRAINYLMEHKPVDADRIGTMGIWI